MDQHQEKTLMHRIESYIRAHGIEISVQWNRPDPNAFPDYFATVDGEQWAFELTELRRDHPKSHRKVGSKPGKPVHLAKDLQTLSEPIPCVRDDTETLRKTLNARLREKGKRQHIDDLKGKKYCLVVHNRQFLFIPSWEALGPRPDLGAFDAVLVLHEEDLPANVQVIEVWKDGFRSSLDSRNLSDLADMEESISEQLFQSREAPQPPTQARRGSR